MEESEKLYEELQRLEGTLPKIELEESEVMQDPETQDQLITLLVGQRLLGPNAKGVKEIEKHLEGKAKEIRRRREAYHRELGEISKRLGELTRPVIRSCVEELSDLGQRPKLLREILDRTFHGFSQKTFLTVRTNEKAISQIHQLVREGTKKIQAMALSPISEIRGEFSRIKTEIEAVDWRTSEKIENVDEQQFFKFSFPNVIDSNYKGPLTGTPMRPPELPDSSGTK
jgi:hypothetical protein